MQKRYHIEIGQQGVTYRVIRSGRKKTVGIEMTPHSGILVRAPRRLTHAEIREILSKRSKWIKERMELIQGNRWTCCPHTFDSGDRFLFLGGWLTLERFSVPTGNLSVSLEDGSLKVCVPECIPTVNSAQYIRASLIDWYRRQAAIILPKRVAAYVRKVHVPVPPVRIGNARRTWGSCGAKGRLSFSWRIVMAQLSTVDYVVVHELCHLKRKDHSKAFWEMVGKILPDYAERREQLHLEGHLYDF